MNTITTRMLLHNKSQLHVNDISVETRKLGTRIKLCKYLRSNFTQIIKIIKIMILRDNRDFNLPLVI